MKNPQQRIPVMTTTNEFFLPTRLVYEVYDPQQLRARVRELFEWHPMKGGWTWSYEGAAKQMGFPPGYNQIPLERQPIVLATCYLVADHTFHVYTGCGLRTVKFLVYFDQQVPRSVALGQFIDQYNLITCLRPGEPMPVLEDFFKDEAKIEFSDINRLLDEPNSEIRKRALVEFQASLAQRTLVPLERHRLEGFYADGPRLMEQTQQYRDVMAWLQHKSDQPIRPMEVISRLLAGEKELLPNLKQSQGGILTGKPLGR